MNHERLGPAKYGLWTDETCLLSAHTDKGAQFDSPTTFISFVVTRAYLAYDSGEPVSITADDVGKPILHA